MKGRDERKEAGVNTEAGGSRDGDRWRNKDQQKKIGGKEESRYRVEMAQAGWIF